MLKKNHVMDKNEIASLGASLREIEQKLLKPGHQAGHTKIWFQGEEPYFDMFFECNNDEILWFQFTLRGKSLSWDKRKPEWQTGTTNELCLNDVGFYAATKTIDNDHQPDWGFIYLVKSILETRAKEPIFAQALALFK
ncbi:hypothetical protein [Nostoc sp. CCY0012]|uniref:hypothetical protein n=1 Tax=Nostoc sp. CCY0012 TaxID=1056123 RepID=UPI0039C69363